MFAVTMGGGPDCLSDRIRVEGDEDDTGHLCLSSPPKRAAAEECRLREKSVKASDGGQKAGLLESGSIDQFMPYRRGCRKAILFFFRS